MRQCLQSKTEGDMFDVQFYDQKMASALTFRKKYNFICVQSEVQIEDVQNPFIN